MNIFLSAKAATKGLLQLRPQWGSTPAPVAVSVPEGISKHTLEACQWCHDCLQLVHSRL